MCSVLVSTTQYCVGRQDEAEVETTIQIYTSCIQILMQQRLNVLGFLT